MKTIKQIPGLFSGKREVKGYEFALICKTVRGFCYEVRLNGTITHYEVFRLKINYRWSCISYPTSKAFGIWAWTHKCLEDALRKLNSL
jgi:hypothetical protein